MSKGIGAFEFWRDLPYSQKKAWPNLRLAAMKLCAATTSESDSERQFSRTSYHHQNGRATLGVVHVGRLVFVREEILNELEEASSEIHTAVWLERLEEVNELEVGLAPPPPTDDTTAATIAVEVVATVGGGAANE